MQDTPATPVYGHYAALINHPAYYYLYGLYADYPINNAFLHTLEAREALRIRLREVQPLLWYFRPYRKSYTLRLFTERSSLARFSPELVDEAWRQLRLVIQQIGPPPQIDGRKGRNTTQTRQAASRGNHSKRLTTSPKAVPDQAFLVLRGWDAVPPRRKKPKPRATPIDFTQEA